MTDRAVTPAIMVLGACCYVLLTIWHPDPAAAPFFGAKIYDYYFLSLIDGRLDVPARIVSLEGHYVSDGRAYVYHGLAPLVVRAVLHPFVDLRSFDAAPVAIAVFAIAGTAIYHATFAAVVRHGAAAGPMRTLALVAVGVTAWLATPGIYLVANGSIFQEPVVAAYFSTACYVALMTGVMLFAKSPRDVIIPLALAAGFTVFARPHVAVGLYAGVVLLTLVHLRHEGVARLGRFVAAFAVLGAAGCALLAYNALRFGDITTMHGSLGTGALEMGWTFWGVESPETPRVRGFAEDGRFNIRRILPNLLLYSLHGGFISEWVTETWTAMTASLGFMRIEAPAIGFVYLWLPWLVVILFGLAHGRGRAQASWVLLTATAIGALFILSYPTITLRYRSDIWPVVATLVVLALARLADGGGRAAPLLRPGFLALLAICCGLAASFTAPTVAAYKVELYEEGSSGRWSRETCETIVARRGFAPGDIDRICTL